MAAEIDPLSRLLGNLENKLDMVAHELSAINSKVTGVYDKQVMMNGSVSKAHWRSDEIEKEIIAINENIQSLSDRANAVDDLKKKVMWTTVGLSTGGAFAGSKLASFFSGLFQ